jgi:hypothetical protein
VSSIVYCQRDRGCLRWVRRWAARRSLLCNAVVAFDRRLAGSKGTARRGGTYRLRERYSFRLAFPGSKGRFSSTIRVDARRTATTGASRAPGRRARKRSCWCDLCGGVDDVCGSPRRVSARPAPPVRPLGVFPVRRNPDGPRDLRVLAACDASGPAYSHAGDRRGFFARVCLFRVGGGSTCDPRVRADSASILAVRRGGAWDHSVLSAAIALIARWRRWTSLYKRHSSPARQSARAGPAAPRKRSVNPSRLLGTAPSLAVASDPSRFLNQETARLMGPCEEPW